MTGRRVSLSSDLLQAALALPEETTAPADLRGSIAAAIMVTPQRPAPVRARIAAAFTVLPRPVRLAISALLLAALLVGLAAVGALLFPRPGVLGDSSTFRGDVARTGVVVGPGPGAKMSIGFRTTLGGQIVSSPAVVDRMAYIGAIDGTFRAFDLDRGREAWTAEVNVAWSSPSVAGDLVIVGSEDRELVALDRHTGAFAWRVPLDAFAAGSPAIHDGRIYVATSSEQSRGRSIPGATGKIVAIDLASHEILWQEDLPGPSTRSIAAQDSILVVPTDVGIAVAFDTGTGRELWRFSTEAFTDTPVIGGDTVYLAGLDLEGTRGSLWAVDLRSGAKLWPHTRPSGQTIPAPVVHADSGVVHAGTVDGDVVALRAIDGAVVWTRHVGAEIASSPTRAGDILYVATNAEIFAMDAGTGDVLGTLAIDGIPFSPAVAGGYLVLGTQAGTLYAIVREEDRPSATRAVSTADSPSARPSATGPITTPSLRSAPAPLVPVWEKASEDLTLGGPHYLNIAPDGRLWIADSTRDRFVIVDPDGSLVDTWQPTGEAALDLVQPDNDGWGAVAFLPDGGFVVTDTNHQRILRFDAARNLIGSSGTFGPGPNQFISPFGVTVGPDGLIYVVDDPSCRVQIFDQGGRYLRTVAGGSDIADRCTNNVVIQRDGTVYLPNGGRGSPWRITAFGPDGQILRQIGEGFLREPVMLAAGRNGELYATDSTDMLHLFSSDGELIASWSGRGLELAVIGPTGEVYATGPEGAIRRFAFPSGP